MADVILVQWVLLDKGLMSTLLQMWFAFSVAASSNKMTGGVMRDVVHRLYEGIFILPQCRASGYTCLHVIN